MKNNWSVKLPNIIMEYIRKLLQIIRNYQLAPIVSGGAAMILLREVVFSKDLDQLRMQWAVISLLILFVISASLYYLLNKLEKDKDVYLISSIGKLVEDVFRRYGQMMAEKNADQARAEDMNKIMQTIVNLVAKMKSLGDKKYKN